MKNIKDVLKGIGSGAYDEMLKEIYGEENLTAQHQRLIKALNEFEFQFGPDRDVVLFSVPGRTEICGCHTDHQWGNVLSAGINFDTIAVASPNNDGIIRVKSKGFPMDEIAVSLSVKSNPNEYSPLGDFVIADLDPYPEEELKSVSLIRGVAARFYLMGKKIDGFDCYTTSDIKKMGISSAAAFEVLLGCIINNMYMDNTVSPREIAEIGQFAENYYYKKPSGLMDQLTSALGGIQWIDFYDSDTPFVTGIDFDFQKYGYTICILDSGRPTHNDTSEYEAIRSEMMSVSNFFGKTALSRVDEHEFLTYIKDVRKRCGDRAVLRAWHFFEEDKRAVRCARLLQKKNINEFLNEINKSGRSAFMYLQNVYSTDCVNHQPQSVTLAYCDRLLGSSGAYRIHDSGFGGTVQAFVPNDMLDYFKTETERLLGKGNCHIIKVRKKGCTEIGAKNV